MVNSLPQDFPGLPLEMLVRAKAFLCWDAFPDQLAVQLIPVTAGVGYYVPPHNPLHGIYIFYDAGATDQSIPFFLLFHEAGHVTENPQTQASADIFEIPNGPERQKFEQQAWKRGKTLLKTFCRRQALAIEPVLAAYQNYAEICLKSYNGLTGVD